MTFEQMIDFAKANGWTGEVQDDRVVCSNSFAECTVKTDNNIGTNEQKIDAALASLVVAGVVKSMTSISS